MNPAPLGAGRCGDNAIYWSHMYLVVLIKVMNNYANDFPCISEPRLIKKLTKCPARCHRKSEFVVLINKHHVVISENNITDSL